MLKNKWLIIFIITEETQALLHCYLLLQRMKCLKMSRSTAPFFMVYSTILLKTSQPTKQNKKDQNNNETNKNKKTKYI